MKRGIFFWFKNRAKMKRWMMLILIGVVFASFGMSSMILASDAITFGYAAKIVIYFVIGFTCIVLGLIFLNKRTMELFIEATDKRSIGDKKVNVNSLIFNRNIYDEGPNIVVIGGGSGLNTMVAGLKRYTSNITAVVTVSSYGENLTKDNDKMRYLQLEDIKNGIAASALSEDSKMQELFNYRFEDGELKGKAFSDIYFEAMSDISNGVAEAVKNSNDIFKIYGEVLPVTEQKMKICAELDNGYVIEDKSKIASVVYDKLTKINRVYLSPSNCKPTKGVIEAIQNADSIIIGPGSLYTNIIPNLLVNGIAKAIKESKAQKVYVCNIMTEPGLTDNYSVSDHINAITEHCGEGLIDYCLYDTGEVIPEFIKKYNRDGADLVEQDLSEVQEKRIKFVKENLSVIMDGCVRHNASLIADFTIQMICDDLKYMDKQNDPEYLMMNTKLKADKEINRKKRKALKKKDTEKKEPNGKRGKSKFANKYSERIESIKSSDKKSEERRKRQVNKTVKKQESKEIDKPEEKLEMAKEVKTENIKIKNYEQIRKEMIEKFNNSRLKD